MLFIVVLNMDQLMDRTVTFVLMQIYKMVIHIPWEQHMIYQIIILLIRLIIFLEQQRHNYRS